MTRMTLSLALAIAFAASGAGAVETLGVNTFPGTSALPLLVGQHEGMFQRRGIAIALSHPKGSVDQLKGLMDGKYTVLVTALDNVVAYHDGHGEADLGGPIDLVAFMGMDAGFMSLMASSGTRRIADLEGKTMAVDALTTGFSFVLQELLARGGVADDKVSYLTAGSSGARLKALQEGRAQATLLNMPFDLAASDHGFVTLATVAETLGPYQATVAAVRESWAKAHPALVVSFVRAYREAVRWLVAPAHKEGAIAILHQELPDLDAAQLARVYALMTDPRQGISRTLAIDPRGAAMVLTLRARYAAPAARPAHPWRGYVDLSYLAAARK
jgi:ABC-type nitrate/sulfonate/bicarbonate transport system substrate-binding protein